MYRIKYFVDNHPDLFTYLPAHKVHPHDKVVDWLLLRWLPENITPNRLTVLRIILTPLVFWLILNEYYRIGSVVFLIAATTDLMDGSLARLKNQITNFGVLFDPLADKLLIGSMVLLLVFKYFNPWLGLTILGIEILFIILALVYRAKFKTVHMANLWGKIKMVLQVLATFTVLFALVFNIPDFFTVAAWLFMLAIAFAIIGLFQHGV